MQELHWRPRFFVCPIITSNLLQSGTKVSEGVSCYLPLGQLLRSSGKGHLRAPPPAKVELVGTKEVALASKSSPQGSLPGPNVRFFF